jgi:hypothetical protein
LHEQAKDDLNLFYVDDFIYTSDSVEEASTVISNITETMTKAGFTLRKWSSNSDTVNKYLTEKCDGSVSNEVKTVLGIKWNSKDDTIQIQPCSHESQKTETKRTILRKINSIFDPLGLFSCFTIQLRMIYQVIHSEIKDWDIHVSSCDVEKFQKTFENVQMVLENNLSRNVNSNKRDSKPSEVHIFCDASMKAYGACLYFRYLHREEATCSLVLAKARVAPLKKLSIPRLELLAALLGVKLYARVLETIPEISALPVVFWIDSMAVLHWIQGTKQWCPFIENRVSQIRSMQVTKSFHYIDTTKNVADLISRGVTYDTNKQSSTWFNGPKFLRSAKASSDLEESKPLTGRTYTTHLDDKAVCHARRERDVDPKNYSSYDKVCRIMVYVMRFAFWKKTKEKGPVTCEEYKKAEAVILLQDQFEHFPNEYRALTGVGNERPTRLSKKIPLCLTNGLICVSTRIENADVLSTMKKPILLSKTSSLTSLLILKYHRENLHSGARQTLALLRTRFWIPSGRKTVERIIKKCVICLKHKGKPYGVPLPPSLPKMRVEESYPFVNIGLDFAGPLNVKANLTTRAKTQIKAYICLFTCAVTRAVHLELCLDLTSECFIQALQRFIGRRGVPSNILSDNGTTFVSASKKVADFINSIPNDNVVISFCTAHTISWSFIPPRSPWWGGFYERMVGIVKERLKVTVGNANLNYFELETLLIQIEGITNDRPITYLSECPEDGQPISPAHLLLGRYSQKHEELSAPQNGYQEVQKRKVFQETLANQFWKTFKHDYLASLREHYINCNNSESLVREGDVVHIQEELPRSQWKLGKVEELIKGSDGKARSAVVRSPNFKRNDQKMIRPIKKLYPLEINEHGENNSTSASLTRITKQFKPQSQLSGLIFTLVLFITLICEVSTTSSDGTQIACENLKCYDVNHGALQHYEIWNTKDWMDIEAFTCQRKGILCQYSENFFGSKNKKCSIEYQKLSREACLVIAATKQSVDGTLKQVSTHFYSTSNALHDSFSWLATKTERKWNTLLERHVVTTNGKTIETNLETSNGECLYAKGVCDLVNKTLVWRNTCFMNLQYSHSEICHHRGYEIYCQESDFEETGRTLVCGKYYIATVQGNLLSPNITNAKGRIKHHRLNAAVIQHLEDKIEVLSAKLQCLAQNQMCSRRNETVAVRHIQYHRFNETHQAVKLDESTVEEIIKEKMAELIGNNVQLESVNEESSIAVWFRKTQNVILTILSGTVVSFFFYKLFTLFILPFFLSKLSCLKRQTPSRRSRTQSAPAAEPTYMEMSAFHPTSSSSRVITDSGSPLLAKSNLRRHNTTHLASTPSTSTRYV